MNPLHRPETQFTGELQCFTDLVRLDPQDPIVKARVRNGIPSSNGHASNCWVVGSMYGGSEDQYELFIRRGYWDCWSPGTIPARMKSRFKRIRAGDRIAMKRMLGRGSKQIEIRAVGIVTDVDYDEWCVYVRWLATGLTKRVPIRGCADSMRGPFKNDDKWAQRVFEI